MTRDREAQFGRYLSTFPGIRSEDVRRMFALGSPLQLETGDCFCELGERNHRLGFLHRGLVRYHVFTSAGDDVTQDFGLANDFTVSYGSAVSGEPANVVVTALETCELTVWRYSEVARAFDDNFAFERMRRISAETLYLRKERRELSFLLKSAEERYQAARQQFGAALVRIPQYHLASYLGITPEALSRLKWRRRAGQSTSG